MRKRSELGTLDCPYCELVVKKRHPAQKTCCSDECRKAIKLKYQGETITCEICGAETPRKRVNHRYCSSAACKMASKKRPPAPKNTITCPYCDKKVVARNTRQVTCGSMVCKRTRHKAMCNNGRLRMRTGEVVKCQFCRRQFTKLAVNHVTCGTEKCRKKLKRVTDNTTFWMKRRWKPSICRVCDHPVLVKKFRLHPECAKRLRGMKRGIKNGRPVTCYYCLTPLTEVVDKITCKALVCQGTLSEETETEKYQKSTKCAPKLCGICGKRLTLKAYMFHPECWKRDRNDAKRLKHNQDRLTAEKAAAYRSLKSPKVKPRISKRMEG